MRSFLMETQKEGNYNHTKSSIMYGMADRRNQQVYPPQNPDVFLHEYVLAGWGMPIGK